MAEQKKHFDFIASLSLFALGLYVVFESFHIYKDSKEIFYVSPGFFPLIMGYVLLLCSLLLFVSSLRQGGLRARLREVGSWWKEKTHAKDSLTTLVGILIMLLYTSFLLPLLPFWLSTFIFLVMLMAFLRSTSIVRVLLVSALTVAIIVVFFTVLFHVPLP